MEDLSGTEGRWEALSTDPEKLRASPIPDLLKLCAKYHLPLLRANTAAMDAGEEMLRFDIDGATFTRKVMERCLHCLPELRKRYHGLSDEASSPLIRDRSTVAYSHPKNFEARMTALWIWLTAVLFYLAFRAWYDNWRGPLRREEIDTYLERANGSELADTSDLDSLRRFMEEDDGREFIMLNLVRLNPERVADPETGELRSARKILTFLFAGA